MKEADKLACLVLFLLFQFHSTVRAHFERGDKVRRPIKDFLGSFLDTTVSALKVTIHVQHFKAA